jgi:hypothetical protein
MKFGLAVNVIINIINTTNRYLEVAYSLLVFFSRKYKTIPSEKLGS